LSFDKQHRSFRINGRILDGFEGLQDGQREVAKEPVSAKLARDAAFYDLKAVRRFHKAFPLFVSNQEYRQGRGATSVPGGLRGFESGNAFEGRFPAGFRASGWGTSRNETWRKACEGLESSAESIFHQRDD
jgi:hypothetical protein